jgi:hypothetical protein
MVLPNRGVLATGVLVFALEALLANLAHSVHLPTMPILDSVGSAALLISFLYVAVQRIVASDHRLLAMQNEREIAAQRQFPILPSSVPEVSRIRISASYLPMTGLPRISTNFLWSISIVPASSSLTSRGTVCPLP